MIDITNFEDSFQFENNHWWFLGRRKAFSNLISKFFKGPKESLALDAGCGTGIMLMDLEKFARPIGIDRSDAALYYARGKRNRLVACGDVCNLPFKNESFDLITVQGVLYNEGVRSDEAAVKEFFRILKRGGIMIIDESAYDFLQSRYNLSWGGVRRYTSNQLIHNAEKSGFEILKASYRTMLLMPVFYVIVKLENIFKAKKRYYKITRVPALINSLLKNYLYLEAFLLKYLNFPFGAMVFIVAKKT